MRQGTDTAHIGRFARRSTGVFAILLLLAAAVSAEPSQEAKRWEKRVRNGDTFLVGADLRDLDLHDVSMRGARLLAANFEGASLLGVDFSDADLRGTKGLTVEQLQTVKSLHRAKLDPYFERELRKCCTWLFKPPADNG
jgi:hypothetical protein